MICDIVSDSVLNPSPLPLLKTVNNIVVKQLLAKTLIKYVKYKLQIKIRHCTTMRDSEVKLVA